MLALDLRIGDICENYVRTAYSACRTSGGFTPEVPCSPNSVTAMQVNAIAGPYVD